MSFRSLLDPDGIQDRHAVVGVVDDVLDLGAEEDVRAVVVVRAVSYTHLDVYKRQVLDCVHGTLIRGEANAQVGDLEDDFALGRLIDHVAFRSCCHRVLRHRGARDWGDGLGAHESLTRGSRKE